MITTLCHGPILHKRKEDKSKWLNIISNSILKGISFTPPNVMAFQEEEKNYIFIYYFFFSH